MSRDPEPPSAYPRWQEQEGRRFGPPTSDEAAAPVRVTREIYRHPGNDIASGDAPLQEFSGVITTPSAQVMQVVPSAAYDRVILAASETGGTGTVIQARLGRIVSPGVSTFPGGVIPDEAPSWASVEFAGIGQVVVDLPLTTAPFWVHVRGSVATRVAINATLMTLGT